MNRRKHCFILLEVMVALTIMSIGLTSMMQAFRGSLRALRKQEKIHTSVHLATRILEELQNDLPDDFSGEGTFGKEWPGYYYEYSIEPDEDFDYDTTSEMMEDNLKARYWCRVFVWHESPNGDVFLGADINTCLMKFDNFEFHAMMARLKLEEDWEDYGWAR